jgi:inorganic triphosphatase YgiF
VRHGRDEIEAKLILVGDAPERVADELAVVAQLGEHRLSSARELVLRDTYLDTRDRALARGHVALRIRRCGESAWLTLKGPDRGAGFEGAVRRSELELPWSASSLQRILAALDDAGLHLEANALPTDDPVAALEACGVSVIQDRVTRRRARDLRDAERANLAELAIDCVLHQLGKREVRLFEVEVEVGGSPKALRGIVETLEGIYGSELRRWPHDKLATGLALRRIFETGGLDPLLRADGSLRPAGYAAIDRDLRESGA